MSLLRPGVKMAGYRVIERIGRGGMGEIWLAEQTSIGRQVALKILADKLVKKDPAFAERFIAEARHAGRLNNPGIISVHDVGRVRSQQGDIYYFSMEYVEGENFRELVDREGPIDAALVGEVMQTMAEALLYAHGLGMIHRDIKPENIMRSRSGLIKLADFGLAQHVDQFDAELDDKGRVRVMGTPHYMSPEQARGQALTFASDHYSLGATLFTLLTGAFPYEGDSGKDVMRAHVREAVPDPFDVCDCPKPWRDLCMRLMAKHPEDRLASPRQLVQAVEAIRNGQALQPILDGRGAEPRRATPLLLIAGGLILLLIFSAGVLLWQRRGSQATLIDDHQSAAGQQAEAQLALAAAETFVADLPEDPATAVARLDSGEGLPNPYFQSHPAALEVLQKARQEQELALQAQQRRLRETAEAGLAKLAAALVAEDLPAARTALAAIDKAQAKVLASRLQAAEERLQQLQRQVLQALSDRIAAADSDQALQDLQAELASAGLINDDHENLQAALQARQQTLQVEQQAAQQAARSAAAKAWLTAMRAVEAARADRGAGSRAAQPQMLIEQAAQLQGLPLPSPRLEALAALGRRAAALQAALQHAVDAGQELRLPGKPGGAILALHATGPVVGDAQAQVQRAWWDERLPLRPLLKEVCKQAELPDPEAHSTAFLWLWRHPEALSTQLETEVLEVLAYTDAAARQRLLAIRVRSDLTQPKPAASFKGEDLRGGDEGLAWTPTAVLPLTARALRDGDAKLAAEALPMLWLPIGEVAELQVQMHLAALDFVGFFIIERGDERRYLILNSRFDHLGEFERDADGNLHAVRIQTQRGLLRGTVQLQAQLAGDGRLQVSVAGWNYDLSQRPLPADGPVRIGFACVNLTPHPDTEAIPPALLIQSLSIDGRRPLDWLWPALPVLPASRE